MELLCTQSPIRYLGVNTTPLCAGTQALVPGHQVWSGQSLRIVSVQGPVS